MSYIKPFSETGQRSKILEYLADGSLTGAQLADRLACRRKSVCAALTRMAARGEVVVAGYRMGMGGLAQVFALPISPGMAAFLGVPSSPPSAVGARLVMGTCSLRRYDMGGV